MKKLYTLFLFLAFTLPAVAQTIIRDPYAVENIVGTYSLRYIIEIDFNHSSAYYDEMTITDGPTDNTVVFNFPIKGDAGEHILKLVGSVDTQMGVITISQNQTPGFNDLTLNFRYWSIGNSNWSDSITEIVCEYKDGQIIFNVYDAIGLLRAPDDYYFLFYGIEMQKIITNEDDPDQYWKSVGYATLVDPWLLPTLHINQHDYPYKVELQQNQVVTTLYRLVEPYKGNFPMANMNQSKDVGYIQFNIADPDHVVFDVVDAACTLFSVYGKIYCMNTLTAYAGKLGCDTETVIAEYGDEILYTTFKDGVVYINSMECEGRYSFTTSYKNDACFGTQYKVYGGFGWKDQNGDSLDMSGSITFPPGAYQGVSDIEADNNDAPIEYFNLQGVRISHPDKSIYIVRQGSKVSKQIF